MPRSPRPVSFPLAVAALLLAPAAASAHNLKVSATIGADRVRVEAGYDDETPAQGAKVVVRDAGGVVASGTTDDRGTWAFPAPGPGTFTVRVEQAGHANEVTFDVAAAPAPDAPPRTVSSWRPDPAVGAAVGLAGLLGVALAFRLRRRV